MKKSIDKKQLIKLRKEGHSYNDISKQMKCSANYVYLICNPDKKNKYKKKWEEENPDYYKQYNKTHNKENVARVLKHREKNKKEYNEYMRNLQRKIRKEKKKE
jgi:hypothetical protein